MGECSPKEAITMKNWYLLQCQTQNFQKVVTTLDSFGIENYHPLETKISRRKDCNSQRISHKPLFPGYLFVRIDPEITHTSKITDVPGASHFVKFGQTPRPIPDDVILALQCAPLLIMNSDDNSISCRNLPTQISDKIIFIYKIKNSFERQVSLLNFLEKDLSVHKFTTEGGKVFSAMPTHTPHLPLTA
jgi:transcriptional antiterminator RfaH